jgi:glycosyltransferase involved in cell wall biosynthesis
MKNRFSVIVPCFNEARNIRECLLCLQSADEILLVDSFSTDETLPLAEGLYTRLLRREYINSASQKNWAIPQASHEWVLIVDADERIPPELMQEIHKILEAPEADAYRIRRRNYLYGEEVRWGTWRKDSVIRLFKKSVCRYEEKHVHAELVVRGITKLCRNRMDHYSHHSIDDFVRKAMKYSSWGALNLADQGVSVGGLRIASQSAFHFFKSYVLKLGFLDGTRGLIIAFMESFHSFLKYAKRFETQLKDDGKGCDRK